MYDWMSFYGHNTCQDLISSCDIYMTPHTKGVGHFEQVCLKAWSTWSSFLVAWLCLFTIVCMGICGRIEMHRAALVALVLTILFISLKKDLGFKVEGELATTAFTYLWNCSVINRPERIKSVFSTHGRSFLYLKN